MTDTELLILGLAAEQDRYGYEIEEEIERRSIRKWADVGFSSIYYALSSLEKRGFLQSRNEASANGPKRRIFAITDNGRQTLSKEAVVRLKECIPLPKSFYLGLALARHANAKDVVAALAEHSQKISGRLRVIEESRRDDEPAIARQMRELGYTLARAELEWLEQYATTYLEQPSSELEDGNNARASRD